MLKKLFTIIIGVIITIFINCTNDIDNSNTSVDLDGDGYANDVDNCPAIANAEQVDIDGDGTGDACEIRLWIQPTSLSDNICIAGQDVISFDIAMDNNGNAIIVWQQSDGSNDQIFKSEYRGGIWTHPSALSDNISSDGYDATYPKVAMDDNGNAVIVWFQYDGDDLQIFKSEYREGIWIHPASLFDNISPGGYNARNPQAAMDDKGNIVIVWHQFNGTYTHILKSEYREGIWTHPSSTADYISQNGSFAVIPIVAMDNNSNSLIVWQQENGSYGEIFMSEHREGIWVHPSSLSDNISPGGQNADDHDIAMDNDGNSIITWRQSDGSNYQIFMSEYREGEWTHPSILSDNISIDGQHAHGSQIAMDNEGNVVIIWNQNDGSKYQIFKSEYRGGIWTHPSSFSDNISPDGQNTDPPKIAMNNDGNVIIAWSQNDGSNSQIFKSENKEGVWTHPTSLSDNISPDGQGTGNPEVAIDNNGNAIIVWTQSDGSNVQMFISEYH